MKLSSYFERIRYSGSARADLATLIAVHRAHQEAVPFENLDVQLGRPVSLDIAPNYRKIVEQRRGGWCYEMNCVLGWALREIGFDVTRLTAGVMRETVGDFQLGNHLCLLVSLDRPYLVDVGFGGSLLEPLPLEAATSVQTPYRLTLSETNDGYWRFTEVAHSDPFSFDFAVRPADESLFAKKCEYQRADPASPFVQNLVVQRRAGETHLSLRGRVLQTLSAQGVEKVLLNSPDELMDVVHGTFGLDVPEARTLWPAICARHEAVFGTKPVS